MTGTPQPVPSVERRTGRERRLIRVAATWSLAAVFACAPGCAPPRQALPELGKQEPAAVFDSVREREERVRTLRAVFAAETEYRDEQRTVDGVLLVKKPDRFRLRLMLPLGLTVFDYVAWNGQSRVTLPLAGAPARDADDPDALSSADLRLAFLRAWEGAAARCSAQRDGSDVSVACAGDVPGEVARTIRIDARTATIREETSYEGGLPRMVLRYGDYRQVADTLLAHRVRMVYPQRGFAVEIRVRRYEVNPDLPDHLFRAAES